MSLKSKLITTISMFVLVLVMTIVGVFAATSATINMGGNITFVADDINAIVTGKIEGANETHSFDTLIYTATQEPEGDVSTWVENNLTFKQDTKEPIKITVTVENKSTERWLIVRVEDKTGTIENLNRVITKGGSSYTQNTDVALKPSTGDGTSKVEFVITLSLADSNKSVASAPYSYIIHLNNNNEEPEQPAEELDFTFDGNKVTGYTGNETNITIPSSYSIKKEYINEFTLTEQEMLGQDQNEESLNKLGILYALKNYKIYLNGNLEGIICKNGFLDILEYREPKNFPIKIILPDDLTFEFSEDEFSQEPTDQYSIFKKVALEQFLKNYYVKFGDYAEEYCKNYDDFSNLFLQKMPDDLNSNYFPITIRIDNVLNIFVEGNEIVVDTIKQFSLNEGVTQHFEITIPQSIKYIYPFAFSLNTNNFSIVLEEGFTSITDYAFASSNLISIIFPKSLNKIGEGALSETQLSSVNIHGSIKRIGGNAFYGCSNLQSISFEEGLEEIGPYAFSRFRHDSNLLHHITIPSSVKIIGKGAFMYCENLEAIDIANGLTHIAEEAFSNCINLKTINIPDTIKYVGDNVFSNCENIVSTFSDENGNIYLGNDLNNFVLFYKANNVLSYINVNSNCKIIYYNSFNNCTNLQNIVLNEGIIQIGSLAFKNCQSLKNISIPSSIEIVGNDIFYDSYINQINYFEDENNNFYLGNSSNKFVVLIGVGNKNLSTYKINENCKIIYEAFSNCENLTNIEVPQNVKTIGYKAFSGCSILENIIIKDGIVVIGDRSFENCTSLDSLTIPESVIEIGDYGLRGDNISEILLEGNVLTWGKYCLPNNLKILIFSKNVNMFSGFDAGESDAGRINIENLIIEGEGLNGVYLSRIWLSGAWYKDGKEVVFVDGPGTYTNVS